MRNGSSALACVCVSDVTNDGRVELTVDDDNDNGNDDKQLIVQMDV